MNVFFDIPQPVKATNGFGQGTPSLNYFNRLLRLASGDYPLS